MDYINPENEEKTEIDLGELETTLTTEELERLALEELEQGRRDALVNYIYQQTAKSKVMGEKALKLSPPTELSEEEVKEFLANIESETPHEDFEDITIVEGKKDRYLYDKSIMTAQYAQIAVMLEDKDILHTIAEITRSDSKTYPRPTQFKKLKDTPFRFSDDEILGAVARMHFEEGYEDIGMVTASNGAKATYSSLYLSKKYAQSLIEYIEVEEPNNP